MYKKKKKYLRSSHVDGKCEIACFHVETQPANAKNGGKIVVILAVHVTRIRDAKSLNCNRFLARETVQPVLSASSSAIGF